MLFAVIFLFLHGALCGESAQDPNTHTTLYLDCYYNDLGNPEHSDDCVHIEGVRMRTTVYLRGYFNALKCTPPSCLEDVQAQYKNSILKLRHWLPNFIRSDLHGDEFNAEWDWYYDQIGNMVLEMEEDPKVSPKASMIYAALFEAFPSLPKRTLQETKFRSNPADLRQELKCMGYGSSRSRNSPSPSPKFRIISSVPDSPTGNDHFTSLPGDSITRILFYTLPSIGPLGLVCKTLNQYSSDRCKTMESFGAGPLFKATIARRSTQAQMFFLARLSNDYISGTLVHRHIADTLGAVNHQVLVEWYQAYAPTNADLQYSFFSTFLHARDDQLVVRFFKNYLDIHMHANIFYEKYLCEYVKKFMDKEEQEHALSQLRQL